MKKLLISCSIFWTWMVLNAHPVYSQSGNMSDITMPNPGEINNQPPPSNQTQRDDLRNSPDPEDIISSPIVEPDPPSEPLFIPKEETTPTSTNSTNREVNSENNPEEIENPAPTETVDQKEPDPEILEEVDLTETAETETAETETAETETAETETAETETAETETEEVTQESDIEATIDTQAYELQLQQSNVNLALLMQEESYATQIASYSKIRIYGEAPSVKEISQRLGDLWEQTGKKAAFINVSLQKKQIESFTVLPSVPPSLASANISKNQLAQPKEIALRRTTKHIQRKTLLATAKKFRQEISNPRKIRQDNYLESAQQLYKLIIEPIEAELEANNIDILVLAMDSGLRLLPFAALHDGEQFLIEKYAVATVPSFGLTDTRYVNLSES